MWAVWWIWVVAGIALGILEVLAPGYIFLGFAVGAILTGVLIGLGVLTGGWPWMLLVFALASLAAWVALRAVFGVRKGQVKIWDRDINDG